MFKNLGTSDLIQLVSISITALIAVISITISVLTLRQTNKITRESNRPYVVIFLETISVTENTVFYLVLKNFGKTGAIIDSITFEPELESKLRVPFASTTNFFIAPNQSVTTEYPSGNKSLITFTVKYHDNIKEYVDTFEINRNAFRECVYVKTHTSSLGLEKNISYAFQELIRTRL